MQKKGILIKCLRYIKSTNIYHMEQTKRNIFGKTRTTVDDVFVTFDIGNVINTYICLQQKN